MGIDGPLSAASQELVERVQRVSATLPEATMEIDGFGHRAFKVAKKSYVLVGQSADGRPSLSIKSDPATQDLLVRQGGFKRTPYIGQHGWVSPLQDGDIDWPQIDDLIVDAYRLAAPKRLLKLLDAKEASEA